VFVSVYDWGVVYVDNVGVGVWGLLDFEHLDVEVGFDIGSQCDISFGEVGHHSWFLAGWDGWFKRDWGPCIIRRGALGAVCSDGEPPRFID
jgi:hypothetical protein